VFGSAGQELQPGFQRVLDTRHNFTDFQLTVQSSVAEGARRWSINFYPIKDESHHLWLVVATFSELTKRNRAGPPTERVAGLHRNDRDNEPSLLGEEISELLAHSLKLARRSKKLRDDSVSLQSYVSETRTETGLESLHLFLTVTRARQSLAPSPFPQACGGAAVLESTGSRQSQRSLDGDLSRRERQVLNLLAAGKSNKEIGAILEISTRTVETYRARLMNKLKLHSTAELVRYAVRNKIIEA
jgi:DNA-binding CsgD family transcriptional regulator